MPPTTPDVFVVASLAVPTSFGSSGPTSSVHGAYKDEATALGTTRSVALSVLRGLNDFIPQEEKLTDGYHAWNFAWSVVAKVYKVQLS